MIEQRVSAYVQSHDLLAGTHPENLAAMRLHQAGHRFSQQFRMGRYRLDFAFPDLKMDIEVDGPHHMRPDVATKDVWRDNFMRDAGWLVFRIHYGPTFEEQLARLSEVLHMVRGPKP